MAWNVSDPAARRYRLHWSPDADLAVDAEAVTGGDSVPLTYDPQGLPADVLADFPHLEGYEAFRLSDQDRKLVPDMLRGQLAAASYDEAGLLVDATGAGPGRARRRVRRRPRPCPRGDLGPRRPVVRCGRRPPATSRLLVWADGAAEPARVPMDRRPDGSWTAPGRAGWKGASYLYEVEVYAPATGRIERNRVTDPYSVALTTNSARSVVADLADPALKPSGWSALQAPRLAQDEDRNVYELHVRDFSIGDTSVPAGSAAPTAPSPAPGRTGCATCARSRRRG